MNPIEEQLITCPHCGESFHIIVDCSQLNHDYIEDCYVCCKPISITVTLDPFDDATSSPHVYVEQAQ